MSTVMKVQLNFKLAHNMNSSVSFEHIVDNEEEARSLGEHDFKLHEAYMEGFGEGNK